jgi:DnaK suppressor protein
MDNSTIESLAQVLHKQRHQFLQEYRRAEEHLGFIAQERESEMEQRAQEERTARLLASLDDRTLFAVREIDAALKRIGDGVYGRCEACRKRIPIARLRALPAARLCKSCAGERETKALKSLEQVVSRTRPSNRVGFLDEIQWGEAIGEELLDESEMELEEGREAS